MVSELFDSLTPAAEYFAEGSRRRRTGPKNYTAEDAVSELRSGGDQDSTSQDSNPAYFQANAEHQQETFFDNTGGGANPTMQGKPPSHKRSRKDSKTHHGRGGGDDDDVSYDSQAEVERPLTPTEGSFHIFFLFNKHKALFF